MDDERKKAFKEDILSRLKDSLDDLSLAIEDASKTLPEDMQDRIKYYFEASEKQKALLPELAKAFDDSDFSEVSRITTLINSLSVMIKTDAIELRNASLKEK